MGNRAEDTASGTNGTARARVAAAAGAIASGLLVAALLAGAVGGPATLPPAALGSGPLGTPAPEAQLSDLQTRVAVLSTQVAELGGADAEAVAGRLGGSRAGFDAAYGPPAAFPAPNDVLYDAAGLGAVRVTFQDDRATVISAVPLGRDAALPSTQPSDADWSTDAVRHVVATLSPDDAAFGPDERQAGVTTISGTSQALAVAVVPPDGSGCPASGAAAFRARVVQPTDGTASSVTLTVDSSPTTLAPAKPQKPKVPRGGNAVANSSIGGVVNVNGIAVQAQQVRPNATGTRPPAAGQSFLAVQLTIENRSNRPLDYTLDDFALVDAKGREVPPVCGGVDPAITSGTVAAGETLEGWVTFQVPSNFTPTRVVFSASNALVGFNFR